MVIYVAQKESSGCELSQHLVYYFSEKCTILGNARSVKAESPIIYLISCSFHLFSKTEGGVATAGSSIIYNRLTRYPRATNSSILKFFERLLRATWYSELGV